MCLGVLSPEQFDNDLQMRCGSIGAHVRHIIEHYQSLLQANECVDYDLRPRNNELETKPTAAINSLQQLSMQLQSLDLDQQVDVFCSTNTNDVRNSSQSTFARELVFLHSHTTHHMAIVRILALSMQLTVCSNFGKAASTEKHQTCLLYTSPSPRDGLLSRMPSSA